MSAIFTLSGLYQIIEKYDTVADALQGMKSSRRKKEEASKEL